MSVFTRRALRSLGFSVTVVVAAVLAGPRPATPSAIGPSTGCFGVGVQYGNLNQSLTNICHAIVGGGGGQ